MNIADHTNTPSKEGTAYRQLVAALRADFYRILAASYASPSIELCSSLLDGDLLLMFKSFP